jgi:hypothetical protein
MLVEVAVLAVEAEQELMVAPAILLPQVQAKETMEGLIILILLMLAAAVVELGALVAM